jgi:ubiquinone/menaquinone biosynthesis C-methylase UbiE
VVISNGVINLCADKRVVFEEIHRVLKSGGHLQFADIANGQPVPAAANIVYLGGASGNFGFFPQGLNGAIA